MSINVMPTKAAKASRKRFATLVTVCALGATPLLYATSAEAVGGTCTHKRIKIVLTLQPDQAKARATCTKLQSDSKFKAILTSNVFPNAVSSWRTTKGSVDTGTRPWAGSSGSSMEIAAK